MTLQADMIAILIFLLIQAGSLIWLLSKLSTQIAALNLAVNELKKSLSSFVAKEIIDERFASLKIQVDQNERDISKIIEAFDKHKDETRGQT